MQNRLFWGLIIIFVGAVFLAQNLGWTYAGSIWSFLGVVWPVFIVFAGLSILSRGGRLAGISSMIAMFVIFVLLALWFFGMPMFGGWNWHNFADNDHMMLEEREIEVARNPLANAAEIRIHFGAGEIDVLGAVLADNQLASGTLRSNFMEPKVTNELDATIQRVLIEPQGSWRGVGRHVNELNLSLTDNLPLSLSLDAGASDINLDLSEVVLSSLQIRAGASSLDIILGDKASTTDVSINTGASSVNLSVPSNSGVKIEAQGGLSSKNFEGLEEVSSGVWQSANYNSAANKINISVNAGVSSLNLRTR